MLVIVLATGCSESDRRSPVPKGDVTVVVTHPRPRIDPYFGGYIDAGNLALKTSAQSCRTWVLASSDESMPLVEVTHLRVAASRSAEVVAAVRGLRDITTVQIKGSDSFDVAPAGVSNTEGFTQPKFSTCRR
jgi:hypothetical protein